MSLSNELVSQFVKITKDSEKSKQESTVYGTTVVQNGVTYVKLDGSDLLTPVSTTTDTHDGERVTVMIKNHTATVTGNMSSPSARTDDVKKMGSKISEFEIVMAYKVTTEDLEATNATIESLKAKIAKFSNMEAVNAEIENLQAKFAELTYVNADDINAITATIESLEAKFGSFTDISAEELEAIYADISALRGYTADFTYVDAEILKAMKASIKQLDVEKMSVKEANLKYANIDFTNISKATMEYFYANSGLIRDVVIGDGSITGHLVGVTIKGDLIEAGTLIADKLVIQGEDGLYYKLNTNGVTTESEQTEYNSLNGDIITVNSITASKINVDDLVAFDATIGGFFITENAIYSGSKADVYNTTRGIYLDNDGQMAIGDENNFIKYYKDADGSYKLAISARSISLSSSNKTIETIAAEAEAASKTVADLEERIKDGNFKGEDAVILRIDSSRGTVFKNSAVSTVLSVVIYKGAHRITDIESLHAVFGTGAYLEWLWQRMGEDTFGTILSTDTRIGNGGFTFTLSPEDVDTKVVFQCQLITE